jgi:hypothetical protein
VTEFGLSLAEGMDLAGLNYPELWARYLGLGGSGTEADLRRHVSAETCDDDHEHNLIAHAINEAFLDIGADHPVAYRHLYRPDS